MSRPRPEPRDRRRPEGERGRSGAEDGRAAGRVEVRVRYAETDQMGRAYHAHYLVWCEVGRTRLMARLGTGYGDLEERGIFLPVSDARISYRRAAEYEDRVRVTTEVERVRSRTVTFGYELHRRPDGTLLARARTELICVDADGRPRRMPDELRSLLAERVREDG